MTHAGHSITKCKECSVIIGQCRCPDQNKSVDLVRCPGGAGCPKNAPQAVTIVGPPVGDLHINLNGHQAMHITVNEHGTLRVKLPDGMGVDEAAAQFIAALQRAGMLPTAQQVESKAQDWLVWSNEHRAWWRPNRSGYTINLQEAGRYTFMEAGLICRNANYRSGSILDSGVPPETMVPAAAFFAHTGRG